MGQRREFGWVREAAPTVPCIFPVLTAEAPWALSMGVSRCCQM